MPNVFISYLWEDRWFAGRLYDYLTSRLDEGKVFMDVSNIFLGDDYVREIKRMVESCDALIAVIGESWSRFSKEEITKNYSPKDLLRLQISTAFDRNMMVLPILVDTARLPYKDQLPDDLERLLNLVVLPVTYNYFHNSMDYIIARLKDVNLVGTIQRVLDLISDDRNVLILGRFISERKQVLDAIRREVRAQGYIPILFDFDKPSSRDLTETVVTLAHLARFVIADLTDPSSIPHELMGFVRDLPSVAVQPIILKERRPFAMFEHLQRYPWVLPIHEYESQEQLIAELAEQVILPVEKKAKELRLESKL